MRIKINKEIREYTEAIFFGLNMRQLIFSALACGTAVGLYFALKPYVNLETLSWACILGSTPFAALGFIKYNGMPAEKIIWVWIKSEILTPKRLTVKTINRFYDESMKMKKLKEENNIVKIIKKYFQKR